MWYIDTSAFISRLSQKEDRPRIVATINQILTQEWQVIMVKHAPVMKKVVLGIGELLELRKWSLIVVCYYELGGLSARKGVRTGLSMRMHTSDVWLVYAGAYHNRDDKTELAQCVCEVRNIDMSQKLGLSWISKAERVLRLLL